MAGRVTGKSERGHGAIGTAAQADLLRLPGTFIPGILSGSWSRQQDAGGTLETAAEKWWPSDESGLSPALRKFKLKASSRE
jgi:hypothetical protein